MPNPNLGLVGAHRRAGTNDLGAGLAEKEVARSFCPKYGWACSDGHSIFGSFAWFALA
ncbi:MAG: hypothetical protein ABSF95_19485 [Verrucomicrobiota bacterium]